MCSNCVMVPCQYFMFFNIQYFFSNTLLNLYCKEWVSMSEGKRNTISVTITVNLKEVDANCFIIFYFNEKYLPMCVFAYICFHFSSGARELKGIIIMVFPPKISRGVIH